MFRRITAFVGLTVLFSAVVFRAQERDEPIKVSTNLVSVPTIVSDRDGRYIPNLSQSDFTILQDGTPQKIEFFAATEEPINVALLIDTSQSTRPVLGDIKDSARSFIKLLSPRDKAMVVSFDYDTHILSGLTSDQEQLKNAIKNAEIPDRMFGTTLRDAVYQTVNNTLRGLTGRKAIILLTDGKDAGSNITDRDLLYRLEESDTLIYSVFFKTDDQLPQRPFNRFPRGGGRGGGVFGGGGRFPGGGFPPMQRQDPRAQRRRERVEEENEEAKEFLQKMSDKTAGRLYSSKNGKLKTTFASIVEELRYQYRLGFYPPENNPGNTFHAIKVKVEQPGAVVRSRNGYRVVN